MYHCYDFDIPRLFVCDAKDVAEGIIDSEIRPGFSCFLAPYLDKAGFDWKQIVDLLTQRGCDYVYIPESLIDEKDLDRGFTNDTFSYEYVHYPALERLAELTVGEMTEDLLFVCEDTNAVHGSADGMFGWIYYAHHEPYDELIDERATAFGTPFGSVRFEGPDGCVPFKVERLRERLWCHDETRDVARIDHLYQLTVPLEGLKDWQEYRLLWDGPTLNFNSSDERTKCFTCSTGGYAFGIGLWDPNDFEIDLAFPPGDPNDAWGYYTKDVSRTIGAEDPVAIIPVPFKRDRILHARYWVGWLMEWQGERGPWYDAEDALSVFLT